MNLVLPWQGFNSITPKIHLSIAEINKARFLSLFYFYLITILLILSKSSFSDSYKFFYDFSVSVRLGYIKYLDFYD